MKEHISKEQYKELTDNQKQLAESYYRTIGTNEKESLELSEYYKFWTVGRMIEYLDEAAWREIATSTNTVPRWIDIYGCNLSGTVREEWCDKLWETVKSRLEEEVKAAPHRFL